MGDASFKELLVVLAIGLVVLGPERLPQIARKIGHWVGQARRMTRVMRRQLEDELNFKDELSITPPARAQHSPPSTYPRPAADAPREEKHDHYSPAHDADSPGTGVDSDAAAIDADANADSSTDTVADNASDSGNADDTEAPLGDDGDRKAAS